MRSSVGASCGSDDCVRRGGWCHRRIRTRLRRCRQRLLTCSPWSASAIGIGFAPMWDGCLPHAPLTKRLLHQEVRRSSNGSGFKIFRSGNPAGARFFFVTPRMILRTQTAIASDVSAGAMARFQPLHRLPRGRQNDGLGRLARRKSRPPPATVKKRQRCSRLMLAYAAIDEFEDGKVIRHVDAAWRPEIGPGPGPPVQERGRQARHQRRPARIRSAAKMSSAPW